MISSWFALRVSSDVLMILSDSALSWQFLDKFSFEIVSEHKYL